MKLNKNLLTKKQIHKKTIYLPTHEIAHYKLLVDKSEAELPKSKQKFIQINDDGETFINNNDMKNRFTILVGELEAGNNSPAIKNELNNIINALLKRKAITNTQAKNFIDSYLIDQ
jgi:hypothetical protein